MSEQGHTEEKWKYHSEGIRKDLVGTMDDFECICTVHLPKLGGEAKKVHRGNLIAQAPTLLRQRDELVKALKMMMEWIGPPPTNKESFDSLREDAWREATEILAECKENTGTPPE